MRNLADDRPNVFVHRLVAKSNDAETARSKPVS
jgi:hypothetical protein